MTRDRVFYDRFAGNYDWVTHWVSRYCSPQLVAEEVLSLVNHPSCLLDVGIGTGRSVSELVRSGKFSRIVGVDQSARMLARCRAKYPSIQLIQGDIKTLAPKFDRQFDFVISCGAVEHMADFPGFLEHTRRLLTAGGYLLFTYEPIVARSFFQREKSVHLGSFGTAQIFRREPRDVTVELQRAGFMLLKDMPFRAYFWLTHRLIVARI